MAAAIRTNLPADSNGLCLTGAKRHGACRHGAQVQPLQEGQVQVPVEVEEEAHSPLAEEAPQDETALQVMKKIILAWASAQRYLRQHLMLHEGVGLYLLDHPQV